MCPSTSLAGVAWFILPRQLCPLAGRYFQELFPSLCVLSLHWCACLVRRRGRGINPPPIAALIQAGIRPVCPISPLSEPCFSGNPGWAYPYPNSPFPPGPYTSHTFVNPWIPFSFLPRQPSAQPSRDLPMLHCGKVGDRLAAVAGHGRSQSAKPHYHPPSPAVLLACDHWHGPPGSPSMSRGASTDLSLLPLVSSIVVD